MTPQEKKANKGKIVVIEDDLAILRGLEMNLTLEGYEVAVAKDGEQGLAVAAEREPDLVILDVMLPGLNGYEVLNELRRKRPHIGVLMLTAKGDEEDKIRGLDLGADDYMIKPFSLRELLSRVNAQVRRRRSVQERVLRFANVEVDLTKQTVVRGGKPLEMSPSEFALLRCFMERPGRALSRETLLATAWTDDYEGTDRTIDNFVVKLRQKLEPQPDSPKHFITVRGLGYRYEP